MEPFKEARAVLGDVVPAIEQIEDEAMSEASIWVDCMTCIPGETWWSSSKGRSAQGRVKIVKSLGQILSKGYVAGDTTRPFVRPSSLIWRYSLRRTILLFSHSISR